MSVQKTPAADLKRRYPLYAEAGLALALGAVILAFTVPSAPPEVEVYTVPEEPGITLMDVPQTEQLLPPPPPPPAPPPPVEVPDDVEVDDVLDEVELVMDEYVVPPSVQPVAPAAVVAPILPPIAPPVAPTPPVPPTIEPDPEQVFTIVERQPVLIGGLAALQAAAAYPEMAQRAGIEGRVIVQFVVDERGVVTAPFVVRSPHDLLSDAALAAVQQIAFEPGQQRGRPVKVQMTVPVTFRLR